MSLDLLPVLRDAVMACADAVAEIGEWRGEPAVFTRRPEPDDAPSKTCIINPPVAIAEEDTLRSDNPVVTHTIAFYGAKAAPGAPGDETRDIERAAFALRDHLHRKRFAVQPSGFHVIDIRVSGPVPAPVDDDQTVARMLSVTVRLNRRVSP